MRKGKPIGMLAAAGLAMVLQAVAGHAGDADADGRRLLCEMKNEGLVAERTRVPAASDPIAQPVTVVIGGGETITVVPAVATPATLNSKNATSTSLFGRSR